MGLHCGCDHEVEQRPDDLVPPIDTRSPITRLRDQVVQSCENLNALSLLELLVLADILLECIELPSDDGQLVGGEGRVFLGRSFRWADEHLTLASKFGPQIRCG